MSIGNGILQVKDCLIEFERLKRILERHNYKISVRKDGDPAADDDARKRRSAEEKFRESRDWLQAIFAAPNSTAAEIKKRGEIFPNGRRRKSEERQISQSHEWLRAIFDASRDGIVVEDAGKIVFINNSYARMLGYDAPEELFERDLAEILSPEDAERMNEFGEARLRGEQSPFVYEFKGKRKNGSLIDLEASVSTAAVAGKTYIVTAVRDLTGYKRAAQLVKESEERFQLAARATNDVLWEWDIATDRIWLNESMQTVFGYAFDEIGDRYELWRNGIHPHDSEAIQQSIHQFLDGDEEIWTGEYRYARADGEYATVVDRRILVRDDGGKPLRMLGSIRDISERKQAEQSLLESEARLRQSQKMEAIGTLTGGVAHDFNNLLTAILGNSQLALRDLSESDPLRRRLLEIECAGNRAAVLTRQLLAFSRRQHLERKVINLNDSIGDLTKLLRRIIGEDIEVAVRCSGDLATVFADVAQIEQVVMNLAVNARDAMPSGGKLMIETSNVVLDANYCRQYPYVQPGRYVQIRVSDDGCGMDAATKARIFEPFFTTKEIGKGTGLGLSMAYGIVKQHDGHINVYSEIDYGTSFKVYLPVAEEISEAESSSVTPTSAYGGSETILVAEDEEALRAVAKDVLEASGYTVLLAKNGEEAVKIYQENRERIDLLLLDVVMPRMGGAEVFEQIRQLGGDLPVIFMTGYSSETVQNRFVKQYELFVGSETTIVQKPYSVELIERKIREVLNGRCESV